MIATDAERIVGAAAVILCFLALCLFEAWRHRRPRLSMSVEGGAAPVVVAFASQTGFGEELATQTGRSLEAAGVPVRVLPLQDMTPDVLRQTERALFIASTTGEGDAPDPAAGFVGKTMAVTIDLAHLRYAVLAPGDSAYRNFCAFGRRLDGWLGDRGATALFDRIDVDDGDADALRQWQHRLRTLGGSAEVAEWEQPVFEPWTLVERRCLNPDSAAWPAFHLVLRPSTAGTSWQAGDIAEIMPAGASSSREYSIASLPEDGAVELLVRQHRTPEGTLGIGSGWLTQDAPVGTAVTLRIRSNRTFHAPDGDRPMILIGNGTGIAGLRAHLKARAHGHGLNWLLFGERTRTKDFFFAPEIAEWRKQGVLSRLDLAFSRDPPARVYVQDRLREAAVPLREWVAKGTSIYVCGSIEGMAAGVDAVLADVLGRDEVEALKADGRYRRDVY